MALPVAPLGSLPSMNLPYSRQYYDKTSAVDKALSAFLTGLIGQAGAQMTENVMQRDYAEKSAGFLSKLVKGPQESRQQFEARQSREAEKASQAERIRSAEGIASADRTAAEGRSLRQSKDNENDRTARATMLGWQSENDNQARINEWANQRTQRERDAVLSRENAAYGSSLDAKRAQERAAQDYAIRMGLSKYEADQRLKEIAARAGGQIEVNRQAYGDGFGNLNAPTQGGRELTPSEQAALSKTTTKPTTEESFLDTWLSRSSPQGNARASANNAANEYLRANQVVPAGRTSRPTTAPDPMANFISGGGDATLPTADEVTNGIPAEQPAVDQPSTSLAGSSLYEPVLDSLLIKIADFMRNPRGQSSPQ